MTYFQPPTPFNIADYFLDARVREGRGERVALRHSGGTVSYGQLAAASNRFGNLLLPFGLCELGIGLTGLLSVPLIYRLPGVYLAIYRGENVHFLGGTGDLTAGTWIVNRMQPETDSKVLIVDGYLNADVHGVTVQFEGLTIQGDTKAIALQGSVDPTNPDPLARKADIWGYATEVGYHRPGWKVLLEHGYASGDDVVTDDNFTGPVNLGNPDERTIAEVDLPVIAAGGMVDGRSLAAALALGADGVMMASRFLATSDCAVHPAIHQALLDAQAEDTALGLKTLLAPFGLQVRALRNDIVRRIEEIEASGAGFEELFPLISGKRAKEVWASGEVQEALLKKIRGA